MRRGYEAAWDERRGLGIGRALTAAALYTSMMLGCAAAITMSADHFARLALPLLTPAPGSAIRVTQGDVKPALASNAAIIAAAESQAAKGAAKAALVKVRAPKAGTHTKAAASVSRPHG